MDTCQTLSHEVANLENEFETCKISENPSTPTAVTTQQFEETTSNSSYHHFKTQAYFPRPCSANQLNQLKQLTDVTKFSELLMMFEERNLMKDFIALLDFMQDGTISLDSIPVHALLDVARYYRVKNTHSMWYDDIPKSFWHSVKVVAGGPALHLFSGQGGRGIKSFNIRDNKINFAVPCDTTLLNVKGENHKQIFPSVFKDVIEHIGNSLHEKYQEYAVGVDGKCLAYGFRSDSFGDVDCWGFEGELTLAEKQDVFKAQVHFIQTLSLNGGDENSIKQCRCNCNGVLRVVSQHIKELRQIIDRQNKVIAKYTCLLQANPHYKEKFTMCIGGATY